MSRSWDLVQSSITSRRTSNPIRNIVQNINVNDSNPDKSLIQLSIGDPTVFGNLKVDESVNESLIKNIKSHKFNGYQNSCGMESARVSIAKHYGGPDAKFENVYICSGCSGALDIAITALINEGENILIPKPGFSLYQTLSDSKGIEVRHYNLIPEKQWEVDLTSVERLIDDKTRAILINNPSNPCGSVYSRDHLEEIVAIAEKYCIPIIADEIYGNMVFKGKKFVPLHEVSKNVPILTVGGLAKQFVVPGWRVGWIILHDRQDIFKQANIGNALFRLTTLIVGANSLIQSIIPEILDNTPLNFFSSLNHTLEENALYCYDRLSKVKGLEPIKPDGAMYIMVKITTNNTISDDLSFTKLLLKDQSVFVLPGQCFGATNFIRIVFCPPINVLEEAFDRIEDFCNKYY